MVENRSHAVGQSLDKRTLLRGGRGQPVGLYAPLHMAGLPRDTSINRATAVGREIPGPTPAFSLKLSAFTDAFRPCPLDLHCLASLEARSPLGAGYLRRLEGWRSSWWGACGGHFGRSRRAKSGWESRGSISLAEPTNERDGAVRIGCERYKRRPPPQRAGAC